MPALFSLLVLLSVLLPSGSHAAPTKELVTLAEKSSFQKTGRAAESAELCRAFQRTYPRLVKCKNFGTTPEGREMLALEISAPETAPDAPWVVIQAGIHAGEIEGKDAGFLFLRQWLGREAPELKLSWLQGLRVVFIPIYNIDGHERFGPNHRPNQNGPEEMGWRVTSQNLNLNRDYLKIDAPETRALLQYLLPKNPILTIDLHTTDGAEFRHDISVIVAPSAKAKGENEALRTEGVRLRDALLANLKEKGHLPLGFYPEFIEHDNPESGIESLPVSPRLTHGYWALRKRLSVLIETHSYKPYAQRVASTRNVLAALLAQASEHARSWEKLSQVALKENAAQASAAPVILSHARTDRSRLIDFEGYAYRRLPSAVSGKMRIQYDASKSQTWKVPFFEETKPDVQVTAPKTGYIIPASHADWAAPRLRLQGIQFQPTREEKKNEWVEVFRAKNVRFSEKPYEGRMTIKEIEGQWVMETRDIPPGSLFVPLRQPLSRMVMQLLEPRGPDSWLSWGFFNSVFEKKEVMEDYIAEAVAEKLLKEQPFLQAEFDAKVASDPDFARSPEARLEFFYRRHPSWDNRYRLYPVFRK